MNQSGMNIAPREKALLYIEEGTLRYQSPYYIVGNARYHEDWYEPVYIEQKEAVRKAAATAK